MQKPYLSEPAATDIVTALYHVLLARDPDAPGLDAHSARLLQAKVGADVEALFREFALSPEAARVNSDWVLMQESRGCVARMRAARNDAVFISLGNHCFTSGLLEKVGLRGPSLPFDWVFSSNAMIAHALRDDFALFLDPKQYCAIPMERRTSPDVNRCDHVFYRDRYHVHNMFNHRDPTTPEDYAYYVRCVERFRSLRRSDRHKVFLVTFGNNPSSLDGFVELRAAIEATCPNSELIGLAITERAASFPCVETSVHADNVRLLKIRSKSAWLDLRFDSPVDDACLLAAVSDALAGQTRTAA